MEAKDISVIDGDDEDIDYGDLQELSLNTSHETTTRDKGEEKLQKTGHIRDDIEEPGSDSFTDFLIVRNDEDSDEDEEGMVDDTEHPDIDTKDLDNGETFGVSDHDMQYETSIENKPLINHCENANVKNEPCDIESDIGQPVLREGNIPSDIESDIGRPVIHERNTQSYIESDKKESLLHEENNPRYAESNREEPVEHIKKTAGYIESNIRESVEHEEITVLRDCFVSLSYLNVSMTKGGCLQCLKCKSTFKKASVLEKHINLNNCNKKQSACNATLANSVQADVNVKQEYEELDEMNTLQEGFSVQADTVYACTLCRKIFPSLVEYLDHQYLCQMEATSAVKHDPNEEEQIKEEPCSSEPSKVQPVITGIFENGRTRGRSDSNSESAAKRRKLQRNAQSEATIALSRSNTTRPGKTPETRPRANEMDTQCFPVSLQRVIPASGHWGRTLSQPRSDPVKDVFECTLCQQWFESHRQLGEHMATMHLELEHDLDSDLDPDLDPIEMEEEEMTEQVTLDEPHDEQNGTSDILENFRVNQRTRKNAGSQTLNGDLKPDKLNYKTAKAIIADKDKLIHVEHNYKRSKAVNRAYKYKTKAKEAAKHVPGERKVSVKAKTVTVKHGVREKMTTLTVKQAIRRKIIESLKKRAVARREISQDSQLSDPRVMKCFFNDCQETFMSEIEFKAHLKEEFQKLNEKIKTWVRFKGKIGLETLRHYLNDLDFNIVMFSCTHPGCGQMFIDLAECQIHYDTHQGAVHVPPLGECHGDFVCEEDGCNGSLTSNPLSSSYDKEECRPLSTPSTQGTPSVQSGSAKPDACSEKSEKRKPSILIDRTVQNWHEWVKSSEKGDKGFVWQDVNSEETLSSDSKAGGKDSGTFKCCFAACREVYCCDKELQQHIQKKHLNVEYRRQFESPCDPFSFDSKQVEINQETNHGCKSNREFKKKFFKSQHFVDHAETRTEEMPDDGQTGTNDMATTATPDSTDVTEDMATTATPDSTDVTEKLKDKSIISCYHREDILSTQKTQGITSALSAHADTKTEKKAEMVRAETANTTGTDTLNSNFPHGSAKPNKFVGLRNILTEPLSCSQIKEECMPLPTASSQGSPSVPSGSAKPGLRNILTEPLSCSQIKEEFRPLSTPSTQGSPSVQSVSAKPGLRNILTEPLSCSHIKEECRPLSTPSTQGSPSVPSGSAIPGLRNILTEPPSCSQIKEECRPLSTPSTQGSPSVPSGSAKSGLRNILTEPPSCSQIKEECSRPLSTPSTQGSPSLPSGSTKPGLRNILTEPLSCSQIKEDCRPLSTPSTQGTPSVPSGSAKPDACSEKIEKQKPSTVIDWTVHKWHEWVKGSEKGKAGKGFAQQDIKSEETLGSDIKACGRDSETFKCCFAACREVYSCDEDLQQHIQKKHLYVEFSQYKR